MNVDTDTQYAFTRPIAGHMFANYDGVLKIDGEVGNKKAYDPRGYLKKAEAGDDASASSRPATTCTARAGRYPRARSRGSGRSAYPGKWARVEVVKRGILITCATFATVMGSIAVAAPASATCPYGTVATHFSGVCTEGQGGGGAPAQVVVPPSVTGGGANVSTLPGSGLTSVDGVPCTPQHLGTCIALQQSGG